MGRGLSQQQRHILALARAFNAANRGGVPALQDFTYHVQPGDVFPRQPARMAAAPLAWAAELPDYHDAFGLWVLHGFRSTWGVYEKKWDPRTTCRKRRVSMARAVDGLVERGMLCHAMHPWFAVWHCAANGVLHGWGSQENTTDVWSEFDHTTMLELGHPLRRFWHHRIDAWPAYWLTPAGHDVAATVVCEFDADGLVDAYHAARDVWRLCEGRHGWWTHATPEAAEAAAQRRAAIIERCNNTPLQQWARGQGSTPAPTG